ncbi:MAG: ABC transporter permease [Chloroflexota bacterium]|nr:ABC transporter permease [Chloroflexota bacterium]
MVIRSLVQPAAVVVAALLTGALILALFGHNPVSVYREMAERVLLRRSGLEESVIAMSPVLLAAIAAWIASRIGMWNIGIDGQIVAGAVVAGALAPQLDVLPAWMMWLVVTLAGMAAGALWALAPGLLRVRSGVNEIVTTIMTIYVAFSLASWLIKGVLNDATMVAPATPIVEVARRLPEIGATRMHAGVVVAIALSIFVWATGRWTAAGILSRVVGEAPRAAGRIGVPVDRYVLTGFLLSGAVAALAGVSEVIAVRGSVQADWRPSYGLAAFAVLFLARKSAVGLIPAAFLLGMFGYASTVAPRSTGVAPDFFPMLEGLILIFLALAAWRGFATHRNGEGVVGARS